MQEKLGQLAWSIISDVHSQIERHNTSEPRLLTEVSRLTALNLILNSRLSPDTIGLKGKDFFLNSLSYEGTQFEVSKKHVLALVKDSSNIVSTRYNEKIQKLSLNALVNLLGWVHSLGSYRLPVSLNHGTFQRSLGAYYTPRDVADYIVNLTMRENLEQRIRSILKNGINAFQDFMALKILDPACGAGVFLVSALNLYQTYRQIAINTAPNAEISQFEIDDLLATTQSNLYGVDLDDGALEVAEISLKILNSKNPSKIGLSLKRGNSLISMYGFDGQSNHHQFFENPSSLNAFEWIREFPEVFSDSNEGFDFIFMNPPYERLKPNLAEFLRERLASGKRRIHTDAYESQKQTISEFTNYFRESKEYQFATSYSINTYQLFIERALQLTRDGGCIGCIVPSNILGDVSAQRLRANLIQQNNLRTIDDFPETSRMFPGVTQSVSILSIQKGGETDSIHAGFNLTSLDDAKERKKLRLEIDRIANTMGPSFTIPRITAAGFQLLDLLHENPSLGSLENVVIRRGELDLTNNRNAITQDDTAIPLIRGSHISRYSLIESKHKSEFVDMNEFAKSLKASSRADHYKIERIACQQVSNMGQRWRLKFARVPIGSVLANSCNYLVVNDNNSTILDYLLGILNSELMNWRFQITNSNNHVSIRELQSLPLVPYNGRSKYAKKLMKAVSDIRSSITDSTNLIDAIVFTLYGLDSKRMKLLLKMRNCPIGQQTQILQHFTNLQ